MKHKLFQKNFTIIVIGQFISLLGNSLQRFAFSLYILKLTGSAAIFSTIIALSTIPMIVVSPFGGAIADRKDKGKIMVVLDSICCALLSLYTFFLYGQNYQVLIIGTLTVLLSVINSFYSPAVRASIALIVSNDHLNTANSIISIISAGTNLLGPILAGVLYGVFGLRTILILNLVSFFISAVMELFLTIPCTINSKKATIATYLHDIKDSFHYLAKENRLVLFMLLFAAGANLLVTPLYFVGTPYIEKILFHVSDQMYGLSEGIFGLGMITGAILTSKLAKYIPFEKMDRHFYVIGLMVLIMGGTITPWMIQGDGPHMISYWIFSLAGFFFTFSMTNISILTITYVQLHIPDHYMGKTMALMDAISTASLPIGQVLYGQIYDLFINYLPVVYIIVFILVMFGTLLFKQKVFAKELTATCVAESEQ